MFETIKRLYAKTGYKAVVANAVNRGAFSLVNPSSSATV